MTLTPGDPPDGSSPASSEGPSPGSRFSSLLRTGRGLFQSIAQAQTASSAPAQLHTPPRAVTVPSDDASTFDGHESVLARELAEARIDDSPPVAVTDPDVPLSGRR